MVHSKANWRRHDSLNTRNTFSWSFDLRQSVWNRSSYLKMLVKSIRTANKSEIRTSLLAVSCSVLWRTIFWSCIWAEAQVQWTTVQFLAQLDWFLHVLFMHQLSFHIQTLDYRTLLSFTCRNFTTETCLAPTASCLLSVKWCHNRTKSVEEFMEAALFLVVFSASLHW